MAIGGLDVGTSGCKFVVYDHNGNTLYVAHRGYSEFGTDGRREVNGYVIWENVKDVIKDAAKNSPEKIEGFAIATLGESAVPVSVEGEILYNSMVVGDCRGISETKKLMDKFGDIKVMRVSGVPISEMYSLPKFMWINENTDVFERTKYLFLYEDFIAYKLTGVRKVSYSSAARTMAFDIMKKEWSEELLNAAGLTTGMMSPPAPSGSVIGNVLPQMAKELGLPSNTVIVVGGHDQNCATLGGGVCSPEYIEDGLGTCEVMSVMLTYPRMDDYMIKNDLVCIPYVLPDKYLTYLVLPTCGILINWFRDVFFNEMYREYKARGENVLKALDEMAGDLPTNLLVLPQFGSAGIPRVDYEAKGLFWGLTVHTQPIEMYRAVIESISYQMLLAYETLTPFGINCKNIRITGGGSSPLTAQMRADIFNKEVTMLKNKESGTLGCAILAGAALGVYKNIEDGIEKAVQTGRTFYPDTKRREIYMKKYEKFKKLYALMSDFK